jgi:hypothetical protein
MFFVQGKKVMPNLKSGEEIRFIWRAIIHERKNICVKAFGRKKQSMSEVLQKRSM